MTVKSVELKDGQAVARRSPSAGNKLIAAFLWVVACVTTWQLVAAITPGMAWWYQVGVGIVLQVVFTALERPMLRGRPNRVSGAVLFIDTLVNAGGVFPYALRLSATPTVQMVSAAFSISTQISAPAAMALALLLGFLLAAAPEAVWRWGD